MGSKLSVIVILAVALTTTTSLGDIVWPADQDWTALTQGTDFYHDVSGEINPAEVDLIGSASSYSAGYWALVEKGDIAGGATNDLFMLRMRLRGNGAGKKFVWQACTLSPHEPTCLHF